MLLGREKFLQITLFSFVFRGRISLLICARSATGNNHPESSHSYHYRNKKIFASTRRKFLHFSIIALVASLVKVLPSRRQTAYFHSIATPLILISPKVFVQKRARSCCISCSIDFAGQRQQSTGACSLAVNSRWEGCASQAGELGKVRSN